MRYREMEERAGNGGRTVVSCEREHGAVTVKVLK